MTAADSHSCHPCGLMSTSVWLTAQHGHTKAGRRDGSQHPPPTFCTCVLGSITGLLLSTVSTWCSWPTSGLTAASSAPSPAPAASATLLSSRTTATCPAAATTSSMSSLWWLVCRCTSAACCRIQQT